MTDDRRPTGWADERLAAAFRARSAALPTPSDLVLETMERVRVAPRHRPFRFGFVHIGGVAAAAAVLAIVAVGMFGPRPTTEPGNTNAATFGLKPITVSDAIAIRDGGVDDRELAVSGYYATAGRVPCPAPPDFLPLNPTRPWCPMTLTWLMERPEQLVHTSSAVVVGGYPSGPSFNPSLTLVDPAGLPQDASTVAPVTLIGHFDDRRAEFCPDDERSSCADTFVVDRIAILDGRLLETTTVRELETPPASTADSIDDRVRSIVPDMRVLSRRVTTADRLGVTEPAFLGRRGLLDPTPDPVWLVAALPPVDSAGRAVARTFLVPDNGSDPILEMTRDGEHPVTESASPSPATSPTPTESSVTTTVGDPISVADAIDHRDNHLDDTELAVRGFAWRGPPIPCPWGLVDSPALDQCPDSFTLIADETPRNLIQPVGVTLRLLIRPETYVAVDFGAEPIDVVVLGHFDDHRATQCDKGLTKRCRRNFVVDAMLDPANPVLDLEAIESFRPDRSLAPIATAAEVERFASLARRGSNPIFAAFPVSGEDLTRFEPAASEASELTSAAVVWVVRYIDSSEDGPPVLKTELVIDARITSLSGSTYVPTRDGLMMETTIID